MGGSQRESVERGNLERKERLGFFSFLRKMGGNLKKKIRKSIVVIKLPRDRVLHFEQGNVWPVQLSGKFIKAE